MKRIIAPILWGVAIALSGCGISRQPSITHNELVRRTQEIMDATAPGNPEPWNKYFADDAMYFDEKGRAMDKSALLKEVSPLPKGYSGSIKVLNAKSKILHDTAVFGYDLEETEVVFGQELSARYHGTDTWVRRNGQWQIIAGQMLRYYEDPARGPADARDYAKYAGTYQLADGITRIVQLQGGGLSMQHEGRPTDLLIPEAGNIFFRKGIEGRILFRQGPSGKVDALVDRRNNEDIVWRRIQ
ncbi:MAG TPA: DUF4440 domain-containing protein [Candidatus Eisenbacteria bacterium]|nr:DUF4440 domain-containing protein [Candidatus Eisenbacteria bacterium]